MAQSVFKCRDSIGLPRKILLIKSVEQGSTVLAYPAICRAIEMVGRQNVYFWVFEENREILDLLDLIPPENVLVARSDHLWTFLLDVVRTLWKVRELGIDGTVDMELFARASAILGFLTGAKRRVGLHRFTSEAPYRGDLLTHRVQYNPYTHVAQLYYMMVETLTQVPGEVPLPKRPVPRVDLTPPRFKPSQDELERVQGLLDHLAGRKVRRPITLMNPNASDMLPLRRWPSERFVDLGKEILLFRRDATLVITGSSSEQTAAGEITAAIGSSQVLNLAGKTSLRELLVLYSLADILVTNDSGPSHFSAMTDIQTISLFGPETPVLYRPLGKNARIVWSGLACSPCVNVFNHRFSPCKDNVCMQSISVGQVLEIVRGLLTNMTSGQ